MIIKKKQENRIKGRMTTATEAGAAVAEKADWYDMISLMMITATATLERLEGQKKGEIICKRNKTRKKALVFGW